MPVDSAPLAVSVRYLTPPGLGRARPMETHHQRDLARARKLRRVRRSYEGPGHMEDRSLAPGRHLGRDIALPQGPEPPRQMKTVINQHDVRFRLGHRGDRQARWATACQQDRGLCPGLEPGLLRRRSAQRLGGVGVAFAPILAVAVGAGGPERGLCWVEVDPQAAKTSPAPRTATAARGNRVIGSPPCICSRLYYDTSLGA